MLPGDLAAVDVHCRHPTPLLLGRDHLEGATEPELGAARVFRRLDVVGHRLVQVEGDGQPRAGVERHRGPLHTAVGAGQHARTAGGRQNPHVLLRNHRLGEADEVAIRAVVDVDVPGLPAVDHAGDRLAGLILHVDEDGRAHRVQVPHVVSDVLEVALVGARVEVHRHDRVRIKIVTRPLGAVEIG